MKRAILPALMIALLCACSSPEELEENFNHWRHEVENVSLRAQVTISHDEHVGEYELGCDYSPEETVIEILAPENLKGIKATKRGEDTQLEYDDLIVSLGEVDGITPATAVPMLLDTIREGYVDMCYTEKANDDELLAVQFSPENGVTIHLWLTNDNVPLSAEFESDSQAGIKIAITDWNLG